MPSPSPGPTLGDGGFGMTDIAQRHRRFLDDEGVSYEHVRHRTDYTAKQATVDTETPERLVRPRIVRLSEHD